MGRLARVFFLFLCLFSFRFANADWGPGSQDWLKSYDQYPKLFTSGNAITVWSVAQTYRFNPFTEIPKTKYIPSKYFATKRIKTSLLMQHNSSGKIVRAPLMVFLPGVFGGLHSSSTLQTMKMLKARGFHVLALPNPWTEEYIGQKPLYLPGSAEGEADTVLDVIDSAKQEIGEEFIDGVSISGESYGGFLSIVAAARDNRFKFIDGSITKVKVIDGSITAFSPPAIVIHALNVVDAGMKRTAGRFAKKCSKKMGRLSLKLFNASKEADFSTRLIDCIDPILYQFFRTSLVTTAKALPTWQYSSKIPSSETDGDEYRVWKKSMNFENFVKQFMPKQYDTYNVESARSHLSFWIPQLSDDHMAKVRIITAKDDFLNEPSVWDQPVFTALRDTNRLLVLPWGGHGGYMVLGIFQDLLDRAFPSRQVNMPELKS